jgi:hypothetical protein
MTSLSAVLTGSQAPTLLHLPDGGRTTAGSEVIELAASAGLILDPWQCDVLNGAMLELPGGRWAAFEAGVIVPRQNGKGGILQARQLAGLFVLGEKLQVHTAHEFKTAFEHFLRVKELIEGCPELDRKVQIIRQGTGDQSVELKNGQRLRFLARNKKSGRGLTGDTVYLDEAFALTAAMMGALLPTLRAVKNPQVWYASSAPMFESDFLHSLLRRAEGDDPRLFLAAWENPTDTLIDDVDAWLRVNPAVGYRIWLETIESELRTLRGTPEGLAEFLRECIGIREGGDGEAGVINYADWVTLHDKRSTISSRLSLGLSVSPDGAWSTFSTVGRRADGNVHVDTNDRRAGTGWVVARAVELHGKHQVPICVNPASATGALLKPLAEARVPVVEVGEREYGQACVAVLEAIRGAKVRHLDQETMNRAAAAAGQRDLGREGLWVWSRPGMVDISPLTAATLAWTRLDQAAGTPSYVSLDDWED